MMQQNDATKNITTKKLTDTYREIWSFEKYRSLEIDVNRFRRYSKKGRLIHWVYKLIQTKCYIFTPSISSPTHMWKEDQSNLDKYNFVRNSDALAIFTFRMKVSHHQNMWAREQRTRVGTEETVRRNKNEVARYTLHPLHTAHHLRTRILTNSCTVASFAVHWALSRYTHKQDWEVERF